VLWELIVLAKDNKSDAVDLVRNTFISYIATTHTNAPPMCHQAHLVTIQHPLKVQ
jgi:hypothetical protein